MPEWLKTRYRSFCGDRVSGNGINVTVTLIEQPWPNYLHRNQVVNLINQI